MDFDWKAVKGDDGWDIVEAGDGTKIAGGLRQEDAEEIASAHNGAIEALKNYMRD